MLDYRPSSREEWFKWARWKAWRARFEEKSGSLRLGWRKGMEWDSQASWWSPVEELASASRMLSFALELPANSWLLHVATKAFINLRQVCKCPVSPRKASCYLGKVASNANDFLQPFGLRVSNKALAEVLNELPQRREGVNRPFLRRPRKAGKTAAALTLSGLLERSFGTRVCSKASLRQNENALFSVCRGIKPLLGLDPLIRHWLGAVVELGIFSNLRDAHTFVPNLEVGENHVRGLFPFKTEIGDQVYLYAWKNQHSEFCSGWAFSVEGQLRSVSGTHCLDEAAYIAGNPKRKGFGWWPI